MIKSVAAIDFDSKYREGFSQQHNENKRNRPAKAIFLLHRLRLFNFRLNPSLFSYQTFFAFLTGPSEVFAIIGLNETLGCQANEPVIWWSKDNQNITKTDKRYAFFNPTPFRLQKKISR